MKHKMTGMVAFLVLCCILAESRAHDDYLLDRKPVGPLVWAPNHKLRAGKTYLSLGWGSDQPIDITSKKVDFKNIRNGEKITFEGNVKMKHGDVILACDRLVILYDRKIGVKTAEGANEKLPKGLENASQIKSITASGNVKIVQNERMAVADEVLYDNGPRTIILKGAPARLRDGPELLKGGQIIINRDENRKGPVVEPIPDRK